MSILERLQSLAAGKPIKVIDRGDNRFTIKGDHYVNWYPDSPSGCAYVDGQRLDGIETPAEAIKLAYPPRTKKRRKKAEVIKFDDDRKGGPVRFLCLTDSCRHEGLVCEFKIVDDEPSCPVCGTHNLVSFDDRIQPQNEFRKPANARLSIHDFSE